MNLLPKNFNELQGVLYQDALSNCLRQRTKMESTHHVQGYLPVRLTTDFSADHGSQRAVR